MKTIKLIAKTMIRGLPSMVYKIFDKKFEGSGKFEGKSMSNQQLANELDTPIIRTFTRRKVYSSFKDNIWVADLADLAAINRQKEQRN